METQNITLSLPRRLLRRLKVVAARRETSVSRLIAGMIEEVVSREDEYDEARRRAVARMKRGWDLGTEGRVAVSRDELHER